MTTIAITGINSYFAKTVLPKLEADPEIESIIGIDVTPWKGPENKEKFKEATGWQPQYTTEEAFRDFLDSVK